LFLGNLVLLLLLLLNILIVLAVLQGTFLVNLVLVVDLCSLRPFVAPLKLLVNFLHIHIIHHWVVVAKEVLRLR